MKLRTIAGLVLAGINGLAGFAIVAATRRSTVTRFGRR
jgi:hypothetical protein